MLVFYLFLTDYSIEIFPTNIVQEFLAI